MLKKAILALLDCFEGYICQILLVFFVVVLFMQIILRATGFPLTWTEEAARYAFLWFILFGACYATRLSALNRVTMQLSLLPPVVAKTCLLLGDLVWLCFSLTMAYYGWLSVVELIELPYHTPALDWDLSRVYLVFPFCFFLMAVRIVQVDICRYVLKMDIADPDKEAVEESKTALIAEAEDKP